MMLAVFGIFVAIFSAVAGLEALQERRSVPLEDVGTIDGDYVDAVYSEDNKRREGSIINITSTRRNGFVMRGTAFNDKTLKETGKFTGTALVGGADGLCYYYRGHEGPTTDEGVCYYRFSKHGNRITFVGGFMAFGLKTTSHRVQGRKVLKEEEHKFRADPKSVLRRYLEREAPPTRQPSGDDQGVKRQRARHSK
jgi:hypothetical protein